jgi:hypothetical protein
MLKNKIAALILVLGTALTLIAPRLALADVKNQPDVKDQLNNGVDAAAGGAPSCTVNGHAGSPSECSSGGNRNNYRWLQIRNKRRKQRRRRKS